MPLTVRLDMIQLERQYLQYNFADVTNVDGIKGLDLVFHSTKLFSASPVKSLGAAMLLVPKIGL